MRRRFASLTALFVLISPSLLKAQLPESQRLKNLASFDHVWNVVHEKHWDTAHPGLDWNAVRAELRPKVEKAQTDSAARAILSDMLDRLHLTHFAVIPSSVYSDVEDLPARSSDSTAGSPTSGDGSAGLDVRVVDGQALVVGVEPDSSAAKQRVHPGWIVKSVDGEAVEPVIHRVAATYKDSTELDLMLARAIKLRLDGPYPSTVDVAFRDARDKSVSLSLERQPVRGLPTTFSNLPEEHVWIETRRVESRVGYIAFNIFLDPLHLVPAFQRAVRECEDCEGIVIDLRGNPGGLGILAMGMAGYFIDKPDLKLGTMTMNDVPLKFVVFPRPPIFRGPLAILMDGLSASTSEIFAGGMQDLGRARIFGARSAGAALPSLIERLPNGDGFQYAAASYQSESGKTLEGFGVIPDEPTPLSRAELLAGHDTGLEAALKWIHAQNPTKGHPSP